MNPRTSFGFNTFCTEQWLPLIKILIDSISSFSKHPITVNCINFKYDFNNDLVNSVSIYDSNIRSYSHIYRYKWSSLLDTPYDTTVMLDGDMIVLPGIDNLFYDHSAYLSTLNFPLFAKHPHNPFTNPVHAQNLKNMMSIFTTNEPSMPYVYACGVIGKHHIKFVKEIVDTIDYFHSHNAIPYIEDEGILNCLLSKYKISYDLGYNFFPNSTLYNAYINNKIDTDQELYDTYTKFNCPVKFYALHGCKNQSLSSDMLSTIKEKTKNNE